MEMYSISSHGGQRPSVDLGGEMRIDRLRLSLCGNFINQYECISCLSSVFAVQCASMEHSYLVLCICSTFGSLGLN